LPEKSLGELKVNEYHLIFDLNGILVAIGEGPIKFWLVILWLGLRKFLSSCATKFIMYIWFSTMKRNFSNHLEIIKERISVHLESSRIVDQVLCLKNEHFLPKKPEKHVFHKNVNAFFGVFPGTNYENTSLRDDTAYKSLFNPPFNAIVFEMFYGSQSYGDYLFKTVLPSNLRYEKLAKPCFSRCNDTYCNMMKFKPANKKR